MTLRDDWMSVPAGEAASRYASLIYRRTVDGMIDNEWKVDWANAPLTFSVYPSAELHPLPCPSAESLELSARDSDSEAIAAALHGVLGIMGQRLTINLNDRHAVYGLASGAKWGRAIASGGGRYTTDCYLVESGGDVPAGIYHYSALHHGWELLTEVDLTAEVARAQGYDEVAPRYVLTTINYWRSAFKYNDFAYQASAMDLGTLVAGLVEVLPGLAGTWDLWVNEAELAPLLGLDPQADGVYAVQAWGERGPEVARGAGIRRPPLTPIPRVTGSAPGGEPLMLTTSALQRDMAAPAARPEDFPTPASVIQPLAGARGDRLGPLLGRESSFGRFTGEALSGEALVALLQRAAQSARWVTQGMACPWQSLIYVSAVEGFAPGLYRYGPEDEEPVLVREGDQSDFLATTYFLKNYDGRRAAVTMILCADVFGAARSFGVRGYRAVNAVMGAMCQAISVEAVRHRASSGTALGFDTIRHATHAGLNPEVMCPLLMMMIGIDDPLAGRFHSSATRLGLPR